MFNASSIASALEKDLMFITTSFLLDKEYLNKKTIEYMLNYFKEKTK